MTTLSEKNEDLEAGADGSPSPYKCRHAKKKSLEFSDQFLDCDYESSLRLNVQNIDGSVNKYDTNSNAENLTDANIHLLDKGLRSPSERSIKSEDDSPQKKQHISPSKRKRFAKSRFAPSYDPLTDPLAIEAGFGESFSF